MSSDEEYHYESGSDEEYVYSDDDNGGGSGSEIGSDVELENKFWEADGCKRDEPTEALRIFKDYLTVEEDRVKEGKDRLDHEDVGSIRFRVLQEVVLLSHRFGHFEDMLTHYELLLQFLPNVTRNERSSAISNIISSFSSNKPISSDFSEVQERDSDIVMKIYEMTLKALEESNIDLRLMFLTKKKLGILHLDKKEYQAALKVASELHKMCQVNGKDDSSKSEWLLEMYSLEIQICNAMNDSNRVKEIFAKTAVLSNAIRDPRTMGIIYESGGKMYMKEKNWKEAYNQFFDGFKNYQETADPRAQTCLKYVVLANMLSSSDINPFDSREAKAYQDYPQVKAVIELRRAYDNGDARLFEKALKNKDANLMEDKFLIPFIEPLMLEIRSKVLRKIVKPYKSIRLNFISKHLNVPDSEVEAIVMRLVMDGMLVGKIDQINGILHLGSVDKDEKYKALEQWTKNLRTLKKKFAAHPSQIVIDA